MATRTPAARAPTMLCTDEDSRRRHAAACVWAAPRPVIAHPSLVTPAAPGFAAARSLLLIRGALLLRVACF
eukprot:364167-Chlamydomonas_euryale.AAC.3